MGIREEQILRTNGLFKLERYNLPEVSINNQRKVHYYNNSRTDLHAMRILTECTFELEIGIVKYTKGQDSWQL